MFSESEASRIGENPTEADYKKKKKIFFLNEYHNNI